VAVAVEREALARTLVPVHDAVADADAGVTEPVVVAVDREDGAVVGGDVRRRLRDVRAERVLRERGAQVRHVGEHDVRHVVRQGVAPPTRWSPGRP